MKNGVASPKNLERWKEEMPTEGEMRAKDKYTMFDRKEKTYRKGVHSESSEELLSRMGTLQHEFIREGETDDLSEQNYRSGRGLARG